MSVGAVLGLMASSLILWFFLLALVPRRRGIKNVGLWLLAAIISGDFAIIAGLTERGALAALVWAVLAVVYALIAFMLAWRLRQAEHLR